MTNTTLFLQAATGDADIAYTALQVRKLIRATYPIEGVLGNGQLKVTQRAAGANMSVDVATGGCVVTCDTVVNGGAYLTFEDASVNVTVPAAPSTGTRTHLLVEQVYDKQADGGTSYGGAPILVADTGAGATLPKSAYLLAQIAVSAGQASVLNANITDMRNQAAGPAPFTSGPFNQNLSGAGRIQISHGMDTRPSAAFITMGSASNTYAPFVVSIASDVITVEFRNTSTGALGASGQNVVGYWQANR